MTKRSILISLTMLLVTMHSMAVNTDSLALAVLQQAKQNIDKLISEHPDDYPLIDTGHINADSLKLEYPRLSTRESKVSNPQVDRSVQPRPTYFQGFVFQFRTNVARPCTGVVYYSWIGLNMYLHAAWSWSNGRFSAEDQARITKAFEAACTPLFNAENEVLRAVLQDEPKGVVLEGSSRLKLDLRPDTSAQGLGRPKIYARSSRSAQVINHFSKHVLVGDSVFLCKLPHGFSYSVRMNRGNPFIETKRSEWTYLDHVIIPKLPPGAHELRVIAAFDADRWIDTGPTLVDGPPVTRIVKNSWTGRIISSPMTIVVGEDGQILEFR